MRQLQPVLWTKGVLLNPQHLQTQDRFLEDLIEFQLSNLSVYPWGFSRLELDREALAGGAIAVSSAAGILPDGLLFDMPMADPPPAPRPLEGCWEPDQTSLEVYLAIPDYRPGGYNVSAPTRDRNTRYAAEVLLRRDENTGLAEKPIQVARKNFRLLVQGESLEGHSVLRIARVERTPAGGYQLDPRFVPPLLDISASDYLLAIARRLVEILTARSSTLAGGRRQKNQSLADFSITDVAGFWLLYTINGHLPEFRHLFETRRGHPGQAVRLDALAGGVADHLLFDHQSPAASGLRPRQSLRLLHRPRREAQAAAGDGRTGQLRLPAPPAGPAVGLRHGPRPGAVPVGAPALPRRGHGFEPGETSPGRRRSS